MSAKQWFIALLLLGCATLAAAGTYINTAGSDDGTANRAFEVIEGKLDLFPAGNKGNFHGTKNAWWSTGGGMATVP